MIEQELRIEVSTGSFGDIDINIGQKTCNYSTKCVWADSFNCINIGGGVSVLGDQIVVITSKIHLSVIGQSIRVVITDEHVINQIRQEDQDSQFDKLRELVFSLLEPHRISKIFDSIAKSNFDSGVKEGRRQKATEFRKALQIDE